ncbi:MAG: tryptophan halogenase family protein [Shewanella sp.]
MTITKIAIVGGGTAGWLAANHLGKALAARRDIELTLIESPQVPTIGVGEGTVPAIRQSLQSFGISETEFIRSCDVTFKQSIKFINWLDKSRHGVHYAYHHLFDRPSSPLDLTPLYLSQQAQSESLLTNSLYTSALPTGSELNAGGFNASSAHYAHLVSAQHQLCESGKAPKSITTPEWQGIAGYAYHLNALKFAQLLASNAKQRFNVNHIRAHIDKVVLGDDGLISGLVTAEHGLVNFDFYIDCSGTEAVLMKALNVPFISVADSLFVDTALAIQVPTAAQQAIPPYTLATAHQAGWIWDIALTERRGVGLVYSSRYMNEDEATLKLHRYLGPSSCDMSFRKIAMKVGYLAESWRGNCVALGLAQGFLEPLEATSIMLTDFSAKLLAERLPQDCAQLPLLAGRFNQVMLHAWQRVIDFVKLHYFLSDRSDSQFWLDNRNPAHLSEELQQRLQLWQTSVPLKSDFFTKFEAFDLENYLYVLYGMKYQTQLSGAPSASLRQQAEDVQQLARKWLEYLPEHRDLLERIHKYGLQKN